MTITFAQLPKLAKAMHDLMLDSGYKKHHFNLNVDMPDEWAQSAYIIEGFLSAVGDRKLGDYYTVEQLNLLMAGDEPTPFEAEACINEPFGEMLCQSCDLCGALIHGNVRIVGGNIKLAASIIQQFMESVFEGAINELILIRSN